MPYTKSPSKPYIYVAVAALISAAALQTLAGRPPTDIDLFLRMLGVAVGIGGISMLLVRFVGERAGYISVVVIVGLIMLGILAPDR